MSLFVCQTIRLFRSSFDGVLDKHSFWSEAVQRVKHTALSCLCFPPQPQKKEMKVSANISQLFTAVCYLCFEPVIIIIIFFFGSFPILSLYPCRTCCWQIKTDCVMFIKQPNLISGIQTKCTMLANCDLLGGLPWKLFLWILFFHRN